MKRFLFIIASLLLAASPSMAGQQVGSVVALRGSVAIERSGSRLDAKVKSGIELQDAVQTAAASRAKLLFIDDSVLTLGDNSRMSVREFIHSSSDRGKSIFNLLDGKMRAVVGKTKFQVETPTAIAAARGTVIYFEVGKIGNRYYTRIICLEGVVDVSSKVPGDDGTLELVQGQSVTIMEGERIRLPGTTGATSVIPQPAKSTPIVPAAAGIPVEQTADSSSPAKSSGLQNASSGSGIQALSGGEPGAVAPGTTVPAETSATPPATQSASIHALPVSSAEQAAARMDTSIGVPEIVVPSVTLSDISPLPGPGPDIPPPVVPISGQQQPPVQPAGVTIQLNF